MIELYYTGSCSPNQEQKNPNLSLGNYISINMVPSGVLNNFFSNISLYSELKKRFEVIGLGLKNNSGTLKI